MICVIISIAILLIILFYGLISDLLYDLFATNKEMKVYNGMVVFLSDNYPFLSQGEFVGKNKCFVKKMYCKDGTFCWTVNQEEFNKGQRGTLQIIQHESGHNEQLKRYQEKYSKVLGWLFWLAWVVGNYTEEPFIGHDKLSIEKEPENDETYTN
jgi:hypothetical protein